MAMITCPECKKSVSDQAKNCVQCGYPLSKLKPSTFDKTYDAASQNQTGIAAIIMHLFKIFSTAEVKENIHYTNPLEIDEIYSELLKLKLTTYNYKSDDENVLGVISEDLGMHPTLGGDKTVNLYTYTSMCVAAIQSQSREIRSLRQEIEIMKGTEEASR
jgi:hypothetical protein